MELEEKQNNETNLDNKDIKEVELISENDNFLLESPITCDEEDLYGSYIYANQLYDVLKQDSKFIAIDGKYGSGKSSVLKLLKSKLEDKKNIFININFININEENDVNKYHRSFVNQVSDALYNNPYDIEKLFYTRFFSYSVKSLKDNSIIKNVTNVTLYVGLFIATFYYILNIFIDNINNKTIINLFNNMTSFIPALIFLIIILLVSLGYGFYKPEQEKDSPMTDTDKCKNNLCKVLYNKVKNNSTIYFVVDDLDRINSELQLKIISLLYNEYYNLDQSFNNKIKFKFIFMIDINKLNDNNLNDINPNKLFNYIITISNNDKLTLRYYIDEIIGNNSYLKKIFSNINRKNFIIDLIIDNYDSIRKMKHLFNRIITKYIYLNDKKFKDINYSELVVISLLVGLSDLNTLSEYLYNLVFDNILEKDDIKYKEIINQCYYKQIIDNNYYIYLTNFISVDNLLNPKEQELYELTNDPFDLEESWIRIYEILENKNSDVNYQKIINQIYKHLDNDKKILMMGSDKFYESLKNEKEIDVDTTDIYKINYIYLKYHNYLKYENFIKKDSFKSLNESFNNYMNGDDTDKLLEIFLNELRQYIKNLKSYIKTRNISIYLDNIPFNQELFNLIYLQEENNIPVIYDMLLNKYISIDSIKSYLNTNIIDDIEKSKYDKKEDIYNYLLKSDIDLLLKKYIIINTKFVFNIDDMFDKFTTNNIDFNNKEIIILLNKYGYKEYFDKYLKDYLNNKDIINNINNNNYNLSNEILDCLDKFTTKYSFNKYYENIFKEKEYYELYIYSKGIKSEFFKLDNNLVRKNNYIEAVKYVYINSDVSFKTYKFSEGFIDKIINIVDFNTVNFNKNNFWKIDILIPRLNNYDKVFKIFNRINDLNLINEYNKHLKSINIPNKKFIELYRLFAEEMELLPSIKRNITNLSKNNINLKKLKI